jgi:hypothetical protein
MPTVAGLRGDHVGVDLPEQQPQNHHRQRLDQRPRRQHDSTDQAEEHE